MTRWALAVWVLSMSLVFGGCGAQQGDLLSRLLVQPDAARQLGYGIEWQADLGLEDRERVLYAELLGDRIAVLETDNVLSLVNADTGEIIWRTQVGRQFERFSKPVRRGEQIIIASESRAYVYDVFFGDLIKGFDLYYSSTTTPAVYEDLLIFGSPGGIVFAHHLERDVMIWSFDTRSAITNNPLLVGSTVLATNAAGEIYALSAQEETGNRLLWQKSNPPYEAVQARPAAADRLMYAPSLDQSLYALFITSGRQAWRHYTERSLSRDVAVMANLVLLPVPGVEMRALAPETGEVQWTREELVDARPLFANQRGLYLHDGVVVRVIAPRDGRPVAEVELPSVHHIVVGQDGGRPDLYMLQVGGKIMKLSPR